MRGLRSVSAKEVRMNPDVANTYHARMRRVLDHIDAHLDEDLSVEVLAGDVTLSDPPPRERIRT